MANDYGMSRKLEDECSKLKKELKDIKAGNGSGRIKEFREQLAKQEKVNITLHDTIYTLEQKKKQIVQSKRMVSQSEYE